MAPLREITVFSNGDSNHAKTWSNVPYFFTKSLEEQGIRLNRVNLEVNFSLNLLYKYSIRLLIRLFYPKSRHDYFRSALHYHLSHLKIKRALRLFPESELNLFMTYSLSSVTEDQKPSILFGDWTYLYLIENLGQRKAYWFEKRSLARERRNIEKARLVLSLFPLSNVFIRQRFNAAHTHYLGNVVNSEKPGDPNILLEKKLATPTLLFIGNRKYLEGAQELLAALEQLKENTKSKIQVHFIGLRTEDLGKTPPYVRFHGYLDKSIDAEAKLYKNLLSSATWIINTQKNWAAFSAMTEAMYHYTAVICRPYPEFMESYGENCDFGFYTQAQSTAALSELIQKALDQDPKQLRAFMLKAHEKTKHFTWSAYCERFLALIEKEKLITAQ